MKNTSALANVPDIIDIAFLADILKISDVQARKLCRTGAIKHFKVGAMYRITRDDLFDFIFGGNVPERLRR